MRFLEMYRKQSNMPLRIILGGHFTHEMRMLEFKKYKSFTPVPKRIRSCSNTFFFTKENLMVVDHTKALTAAVDDNNVFAETMMEIIATETPSVEAIERPDKCIYHKTQAKKTEHFLAFSESSQARLGRKMMLRSAGLKEEKNDVKKVGLD